MANLASPGGTAHFLIWNPDLRVDVTTHLLNGHAAEVKTRLLDHPNDDAPEEEKQPALQTLFFGFSTDLFGINWA